MNVFKLGLIINPIAGIGGSVALKGSDGESTQNQAIALGGEKLANLKTELALKQLVHLKDKLVIFTASGEMGETLCKNMGFNHQVIYQISSRTSENDTKNIFTLLEQQPVDLILFAGGDGTARNICQASTGQVPVLGIPAGCKIHSGVYAITPAAAGGLCKKLILGEMLSLGDADVMDIDEEQFRKGIVKAKRYGELSIPMDLRFIQAVKQGGKETEALVLEDIAADTIELIEEDETCLYLIGSGSTTRAVMDAIALPSTLLGIDAIYQHKLVGQDLTEQQIWQLLTEYPNCKIIISLIGGQGHILGRGNQQLSPRILNKVGKNNLHVIATKTKIQQLNGKPLIVDTIDETLNQRFCGLIKITTGFHDSVLYPVSSQVLE